MGKVKKYVSATAKRDKRLRTVVKPIVRYSAQAWDSVRYLVDECATEVGWVEVVEKINSKLYIVHAVRAMKQVATGAHFEYTGEAWAGAVMGLLLKGKMSVNRIDAGLGHSHVNMGVTPSSTDVEQMMDFEEPNVKFSLQTIHNKKGTTWAAIYDWENGEYWEDCEVEIGSSLSEEDEEDLKEQLKLVERPAYKSYSYYGAWADRNEQKTKQTTINLPAIPHSAGKPHINANDFALYQGQLFATDEEQKGWTEEQREMYDGGAELTEVRALNNTTQH